MSEGCRLCYAENTAARFSGPGQPYEGLAKWVDTPDGPEGRWTGEIRVVEKHMRDPIRCVRPRLYFVNSMSDLFHPKVPREAQDQIMAVMGLTWDRHTFQALTKRPDLMADYLSDPGMPARVMAAADALGLPAKWNGSIYQLRHFLETKGRLPNVWFGTSCEDQAAADERIPHLLRANVEVRFISYEPALGPINFVPWIDRLDWIIVGGESRQGHRAARPFLVRWALDVIDQADKHSPSTAVYVKQLGTDPRDLSGGAMRLAGKGDDPRDWPAPLRVQQYPRGFVPPRKAAA